MIEDVDETLRALVRAEALNGSGVEISFEAPTKEWSARRNAPTLNLYLYDIREDLARRDAAWIPIRNDEGIQVARIPAPRHFKLSYLVTAWTQRPEDEHRLLSACLSTFLRHDSLGPSEMQGALADQPLPAWISVALPPGPDRSIADVWSALGGELKPSLDLVITTPFVGGRSEEAGPPVREAPRLSFAVPGAAGEARATERATPRPVGTPAARRLQPGPLSPNETATIDETIAAGGAGGKGRVIRVRGFRRP